MNLVVKIAKIKPVLVQKLIEECLPILNAYLSAQSRNVAVRLKYDLSLTDSKRNRKPPLLIENMMIAPRFNECTRRSILDWSRLYLDQAQCALEIPLMFKVSTLKSNDHDE